jgi:hypothetical protein
VDVNKKGVPAADGKRMKEVSEGLQALDTKTGVRCRLESLAELGPGGIFAEE